MVSVTGLLEKKQVDESAIPLGSSVVIYGHENWTIKKAEHQRTDAFELWCWRRLLRVPWTDYKEIKPVNPKGNQS